MRMFGSIDPGKGRRDLMKRVIGARRNLGIISIYFSDAKNASRCASVVFLFSQTGFALAGEAAAPAHAVLAEQHRERSTDRSPLTLSRSFKKLDLPAH